MLEIQVTNGRLRTNTKKMTNIARPSLSEVKLFRQWKKIKTNIKKIFKKDSGNIHRSAPSEMKQDRQLLQTKDQ